VKLPDDPKKRQQTLIAIGMGAVIVLVVLYMFAVKPYFEARSAKKEEIAKKTDEVANARKQVDKIAVNRPANKVALTKIKDISDKYVVHPRTGLNYQLAVREIVEKASIATGVETEPIVNVSTMSLVGGGQKDPSRHTKGCAAVILAKCGYSDVLKLVRAIEKENPFVSVTRVSIMGRTTEDKRKHAVTLDVQWPSWIDPAYPDRLQKALEKTDSSPATPNKSAPDKKGGNAK
jgi:hypothetical protein